MDLVWVAESLLIDHRCSEMGQTYFKVVSIN
jgi:hypothetical protein